MPKPHAAVPVEQQFVLSNLAPGRAQKRLAAGIVLGLAAALYLVTGPFGGIQLGAVHSFVAVYTTAMFVTDTITAILLYAQFSILRSRAILVIASGYSYRTADRSLSAGISRCAGAERGDGRPAGVGPSLSTMALRLSVVCPGLCPVKRRTIESLVRIGKCENVRYCEASG